MQFNRCFSSSFVLDHVDAGMTIDEALNTLSDAILSELPSDGLLDVGAFSNEENHVDAIPALFSIQAHASNFLKSVMEEGTLVRCRGMIQDVQPELTVMRSSAKNFFLSQSDEEPSIPCLVETVVLRVIPVPGNILFYGGDEPESIGAAQSRLESHRHIPLDVCTPLIAAPRTSRPSRHSGKDESWFTNFPFPCSHPNLSSSCTITMLVPKRRSSSEAGHETVFHINDVCDFYGYLTRDEDPDGVSRGSVGDDAVAPPQHSMPGIPETDNDEPETWGWHPDETYRQSSVQVSRLLGIAARHITSADTYGPRVVKRTTGEAEPRPEEANAPGEKALLEPQRAAAVSYLATQLCEGDVLVAEYLLLHLCGHVLAHASSTPLGDVPLLIRSAVPRSVSQWVANLREVVPVAAIPLTKDTLAPSLSVGRKRSGSAAMELQLPLAPQYDRTCSFLQAGALQLANGSNIVVDCHGLSASVNALKDDKSNLHEVLFSVVHQCRLPIQFPFHHVDLPVSVSVLALAPEEEDIPELFHFPVEVRLPANNTTSLSHEKAAYPIPENYSSRDVRKYICAVRRQATVNFSRRETCVTADLQEAIADGLLQLCRELDGWNNHHCLLHNNTFSAVTSLIGVEAASRGRKRITKKDIDYIVSLERLRISSLRK